MAQPENTTDRTLSKMLAQAGLICGVIVGLGLVVAWLGTQFFDATFQVGVIGALTVAVSCGLAHFASEFPRGNEFAMARLMVGMAVRTVLPLLVVVWALKIAEPPLEKSLVLYIILLYFVGLLLDVMFNVRHFKRI